MANQFVRRVQKLVRIFTDTAKHICTEGFAVTKQCPVCKSRVRFYWSAGVTLRSGAQCPVCRCMERHRALWLYLEKQEVFARPNISLLHFAPEKGLHQQFSARKNIDYWPVDLNANLPGIRKAVDITDIPFEDESMDVIICSHVMEHIPDEAKALSEMNRVLKKDGIAIINAPIDENREETFEDASYNTPELRLKYFGQDDHVRIYGRDYADRLRRFFQVEIHHPCQALSQQDLKKYGVYPEEKIFVCTKK